MSDFAAKMHDIDGATVSFASLEIDQTKKVCGTSKDRSRVAGVAGESATTELTWIDGAEALNNKIS